jgi:methanogenic corrinoid protein MtbC1
VVELLRTQEPGGQVRTIIGGAPVSAAFAASIGADAHGFDCVSAVERVKELMGR